MLLDNDGDPEDLEPQVDRLWADLVARASAGPSPPSVSSGRDLRAVFFDAGETLVHPTPSFPELFASIVTREGHPRDADQIVEGLSIVSDEFTRAAVEEELWTTHPDRSRRFWLGVYERFLEALAISSSNGLTETLYHEFTRTENYGTFDDVRPTLERLREQGPAGGDLQLRAVAGRPSGEAGTIAVAADARDLRDRGRGEARPGDLPAGARAQRPAAEEVAYVGDIPEFDIVPPAALGMFPVLIDRRGRHPDHVGARVTDLRDLPEVLLPEPSGSSRRGGERRAGRSPRAAAPVRDARHALIGASERITDAVAADGGGVAGSDWFQAQGSLKAEIDHLAERGILLRDPETGLVDFPARSKDARCSCAGASARTRSPGTTRTSRDTPGGNLCEPATARRPGDGDDGGRTAAGDRRDRRPGGPPVRARPRSLEAQIGDAEIVYTWWGDPADLEAAWPLAAKLRWVQAVNVGINKMLFPALVESDIPLTNARGAAEQPIAESVIGFIVAMAKDFRRMFDDQREHVWEPRDTERLAGTRLLVVGPGPIGRAIARAAREALGMRVEAVGRPCAPADDDFETIGGGEDLHAALGEADFVVNAMPLTPRPVTSSTRRRSRR